MTDDLIRERQRESWADSHKDEGHMKMVIRDWRYAATSQGVTPESGREV